MRRLFIRYRSPNSLRLGFSAATHCLGALLVVMSAMGCTRAQSDEAAEAIQLPAVVSLDSMPLRQWGEAEGLSLATVSGMTLLDDGSIVVADQSEPAVYLLAWEADSIRQLGRAGSGPGEYRRPEVLGTTDDGRIVVRDLQQFRVMYYLDDGSLSSSTGPGGRIEGVIWAPVSVLGEGQLVTSAAQHGVPGPAGSLRRLEAEVAITDVAGKVRTSLGRFPFADFVSLHLSVGEGQMIHGPQYFGWKLHVTAGPRFVVIGAGGGHEIRVYGLDGDTLGTIHVADERLPLSDADRQAFMERAKSQTQFNMTSASLAPERFADSLPVFGGIVATRTGTVWVVAPHWSGRTPAYMTGYSLQGTSLGRLRLPDGFTPLAINDSLVAGYRVDSSDVPSIVGYRLRLTAPVGESK